MRSAAFFLMAQQTALDAPRMNLPAEAFLDKPREIRQSNRGFPLAHFVDERRPWLEKPAVGL
jgi:hypothetical protein